MMLVDLDRGRAEGIALARTLEELDAGHQHTIGRLNDSEDELN